MQRNEYSGAYGIVVHLDQETQDMAKRLVNDITADFKPEHIHLTLFHTKLEGADVGAIQKMVQACEAILQGQRITFDRIQTFGDNFLFWDAEKNPLVIDAHKIALGLARFIDRKDLGAHTKGEKLTLTPEQSENIRRYGHPLVENEYRPHITLAYHSQGFREQVIPEHCFKEGRITGVVFTEIGEFGRILKEIEFPKEGRSCLR